MHCRGVFVLVSLWLSGGDSVTRYISHVQNYVNLVSSYYTAGYSTVDMPPVSNVSQAMAVKVDISLFAINGFDEVAGNIELVAALNMSWVDQMPLITSVTFNIQDRESFLVPYEMIWTPKLVLKNAVGETSEVGDPAYLCRFNMRTNVVIWRPRVIISGACTPDITYYPFDRQTCSFVYTPWGFSSQELTLETSRSEWDMSSYQESGEWEIDKTETSAYVKDNQSYLLLTITIIRKPLYFAFNIVIPVLVLCLLNGTVFLLPAESGERVGFSVTCFLSFVVLLNMIMDILPRSSNPISFLCYYLVVMMCSSGAMTLVTVLLMRVYHKPEKSEVPKWMQRTVTFINCGCAKLKCCVLCWRGIKRKCSCKNKTNVRLKENRLGNEYVVKALERDSKTRIQSFDDSICCFTRCKRAKVATDNSQDNNTKLDTLVKFEDTADNSKIHNSSVKPDTKRLERKMSMKSDRRMSIKSTASKRRKSIHGKPDTISLERRRSKIIERRQSKGKLLEMEVVSTDSSIDSLADLEEEVNWAAVGRICDTFFFLVFTSGQVFFTVVFLVPLFTNTESPSSPQ